MDNLPLKLRRIYDQEKRNIPQDNIPAYDAIWNDYRPRILSAPTEQDYKALTAELWDRIQALHNPAMKSIPPALYRNPGEDAGVYLSRCYDLHCPKTETAATEKETA